MKWQRIWRVGVSCALAAATMPAAQAQDTRAKPASPSDEQIAARANALLARMTPEEKAGQLTQYFDFSERSGAAGPANPEIAAGRVGALLFLTDPAAINRLQKIAVEQSRLKIPLLFGFDVIHGFRTIFPVPIAMAASWDPELVERVQGVAAVEARAVGIRWTFAPMVDVARDPRWGRIVEGAGEDPYLGSAMAAAQVRGFQGAYLGSPGHLLAGPKHFAGYGAALGGRDYDETDLSDSALWNVYLPPFKAAIDAGAGNVMSAYMGLNGVPGAANHWLLTDVLRGTWGFKGFVVSDANAVVDLTTHGLAVDRTDAAARAVNAGLDMEMAVRGAAMTSLPRAMAAGTVSTAKVDDAVRIILETKIRLGLFEHPYVDVRSAAAVLGDPRHRVLARTAAERAAVLLRNEGGLLPLDRGKVGSIAVIGPLADAARDTLGPWTFKQDDAETVTVLAGLRAKLGKRVRIDYSEGVRMPARLHPSMFDAILGAPPPRPPLDESAEIQRAVMLAKAADVAVLVLGEGQNMIGEGASRASLDLPGRQQELLDAVVATGKPVVVLLMNGRPLDLKDTKAQSILDIWYPGSQGGAAVANLLFGDAAPGGRLPFTWPRSADQVPLIYSHLKSHKPDAADARYWDVSNAPVYPFGHGLTYATVRYAGLTVDRAVVAPDQPVTVTVDVKNTGTRATDEVAQLYLHQRYGTSARPVRELKGFQRVTLEPGEVRHLRFTIGPDERRYWSSATRDWVQDDSMFDVGVGGSSATALAAHFEVRR